MKNWNIILLLVLSILMISCNKNTFTLEFEYTIACSNTDSIEVTAQDLVDVVIGNDKITFHYSKQSWVFIENTSKSTVFLWLDEKTVVTLEPNGGKLSLPLVLY